MPSSSPPSPPRPPGGKLPQKTGKPRSEVESVRDSLDMFKRSLLAEDRIELARLKAEEDEIKSTQYTALLGKLNQLKQNKAERERGSATRQLQAQIDELRAAEEAAREKDDPRSVALQNELARLKKKKDQRERGGLQQQLQAQIDELRAAEDEADERSDPGYLALKAQLTRLKKEKEQRERGSLQDQLKAEIQELLEAEESRDDEEWGGRVSRQKGKLSKGYDRTLSIEQAFNFNHTKQEAFGYITMLEIGTSVLQPLYQLDSPLGPMPTASATSIVENTIKVPVVGALKSIHWDLGIEDSILFNARISAPAKAAILGVQYSTTSAVDVMVSWVVYEYDQSAFQYFVAFSSSTSGSDTGGTPAKGQIVKSTSDRGLRLGVGFEPDDEVWAPQNFELEFEIRPKSGMVQTLYLGTSRLGRIFKTWGQAA